LLPALDWAKKCDGKEMPGQKDPSSGKNKFQIISFFAHPFFCPSLKTECQLKDELNHRRPLVGRVARFFLSPR
jgi:hypothetical protein